MMCRICLIACLFSLVAALRAATADEGMWVFNNLPRKQLKDKYGFEPTDQWIEHVMK